MSTLSVGLYKYFATLGGILDIPDSRRPHQGRIPRGAGIVFLCLWLLTIILGYQNKELKIVSEDILLLFLPATFLMGLIGFWDDYKPLSARTRLFLQFILASLFILLLMGLDKFTLLQDFVVEYGFILAGLGLMAALLGIIWSVNLYNFMDGQDGIASIEALFVLGVGSYLCYQHGAFELSMIALVMCIALTGFLIWNWPKASVFMGDAGSYCLGCLISLMVIVGYWLYDIPILLWLILFGIFWFDATLTLVRRFLLKKRITTPHQEHAYQRLHKSGFSQHQILYGVIGINFLLTFLTLYANYDSRYLYVCFGFCILLLSSIAFWIEKRKPLLRDA